MLNEAIVGQLFSMFKEEYGYAVDDAAGLFDGQRDMLEFLMKLGKRLEQKFFEGLGSGYVGPKHRLREWSIGSRATVAARFTGCSARSS